MQLIDHLLDLLYPPKCVLCGRLLPDGCPSVCPRCQGSLPAAQTVLQTGKHFTYCLSPYRYDSPLRESLLRYKFSGKSGYAPAYGRLLAQAIAQHYAGQFDFLTWVPVSRKRKRKRGYDQSRLLAIATAKALGDPVISTLVKSRDNPTQSSMTSARQRQSNVQNLYQPCHPERFAGKRILLIDDIITTGATLSECSRVLLQAGAAQVLCATLAATPPVR